jgi:hypothetical protein
MRRKVIMSTKQLVEWIVARSEDFAYKRDPAPSRDGELLFLRHKVFSTEGFAIDEEEGYIVPVAYQPSAEDWPPTMDVGEYQDLGPEEEDALLAAFP